mgnify:CR=1 FL=1
MIALYEIALAILVKLAQNPVWPYNQQNIVAMRQYWTRNQPYPTAYYPTYFTLRKESTHHHTNLN